VLRVWCIALIVGSISPVPILLRSISGGSEEIHDHPVSACRNNIETEITLWHIKRGHILRESMLISTRMLSMLIRELVTQEKFTSRFAEKRI